MGDENGIILSTLEIDTIGEVLNISMGSAATAISTMLDKQVIISTPSVQVRKFDSLDYSALEPAMLVKINYVEGISGSNVMVYRQRDMQIILNLLMGNDEPPTDDFVFDELSMSAACEVMNQMMGASATALSEFLGRPINISTPDAQVVDSQDSYRESVGVTEGDEIVSVSFHLNIDGVMDSDFASILTCELAKEIITQLMGDQTEAFEEPPAQPDPVQGYGSVPEPVYAPPMEQPAAPPPMQQPTPQPMQQPAPPPMQQPMPQPTQQPMPPPMQHPMPQPMQPPQPMPGGDPQGYGGMPQQPYGQPMYQYGYPPMPYPPYPGYGAPGDEGARKGSGAVLKQPQNVQNTQFPSFTPQMTDNPSTNANMDMLLGVSLDVTVEIGKAKRKIKDIVEFGQGTVIELSKQAGAPVDIVVNGRLLARGDVVVIDDNFGVRITEIVGTKELMESLKEESV